MGAGLHIVQERDRRQWSGVVGVCSYRVRTCFVICSG